MSDGWLAAPATVDRLALRGERELRDEEAARQLAELTGAFVEAAGAGNLAARRAALRQAVVTGGRGPVICLAYQPIDVLSRVGLPQGRRWSTLVELYEVLADLARGGDLPEVSAGEQATALGFLVRTRWHLYAVGFADPHDSWLSARERRRLGDRHQVAAAARQARLEWMQILDDLDSHPLLASQIDPVAEARLLLERRLDASRLAGEPRPAAPHQVDRDAWQHTVRHHLLPRFVLGETWRAVWRLSGRMTRVATVAAGGLCALAVAAVVADLAFSVRYGMLAAAALAGSGYLALAVAVALDRVASWPWLLRQPASAGVGLIVLAAFNGDWWLGNSTSQRWFAGAAAAVLVLVGLGYLAVEAANHGVAHRLRRVAAVAGTGLMHATLVTAIGVAVLLPAFAENGADLGRCWTDGQCGQQALPHWLLFAAASAWSFAAGVFTQILWDDQPFTAPLAHLRWRRGG